MSHHTGESAGDWIRGLIHFLIVLAIVGIVGWVLYRIVLFLGLRRWLREPAFGIAGFGLGIVFFGLVVFPVLLLICSWGKLHGSGDLLGCTLVAVGSMVVGIAALRWETMRFLRRIADQLSDQEIAALLEQTK